MIKRLSAIVAFLEIDAEEAKTIAQYAALVLLAGSAIVVAAFAFGIAVRVFTCTGGIAC